MAADRGLTTRLRRAPAGPPPTGRVLDRSPGVYSTGPRACARPVPGRVLDRSPGVAPAGAWAESRQVRLDDEDDLPGEGGHPGGEPSWLADLVVPDDLSELDAEVRALQRERRARARRERLRRLADPRRVSTPLVVVALLLVTAFASLLVLFQPRRPSTSPDALNSLGTTGAPGARREDLLP